MNQQRRIVCFQERLTHYRESFFSQVRERLAHDGVAFELVHGEVDGREATRNDAGYLPWARVVSKHRYRLGSVTGVYLPTPDDLRSSDLVVLPQENKLLSNYPWLVRRGRSSTRVSFWGHGANFQSTAPNGIRERWKRALLSSVDWWFGYTEVTRDVLIGAGYPDERITVLNNAIDNDALRSDLESIGEADVQALRNALGLGPSAIVGLMCGSLYHDKRIDFLIDATDLIRSAENDFHLVVVGDGPAASDLRRAAATRPWLHWVGAKKGRDKAAYFKLASVVLNPGLVGLHVLDSFCAGVPMVTTAEARHSPEIAYLEDGVNGLIVPGSAKAFADASIDLLHDGRRNATLRAGASASAARYTLEGMVSRFAAGLCRCLELAPKR